METVSFPKFGTITLHNTSSYMTQPFGRSIENVTETSEKGDNLSVFLSDMELILDNEINTFE